MELSNLNHPELSSKLTPLQMFPVSVPRIFKNAGRVFVVESFFSKVNFYILQLCRELYHLH